MQANYPKGSIRQQLMKSLPNLVAELHSGKLLRHACNEPSLLFLETLEKFIEGWQAKRDGTRRGIVEVRE